MLVTSGQRNISNVYFDVIVARSFIKPELHIFQTFDYVQVVPYVEIERVRIKPLVFQLEGFFHWVLLCIA